MWVRRGNCTTTAKAICSSPRGYITTLYQLLRLYAVWELWKTNRDLNIIAWHFPGGTEEKETPVWQWHLQMSSASYTSCLRYACVRMQARTHTYTLFAATSKLDFGPKQPPMKWLPAIVYMEVKRSGRHADHDLYLVARLRMYATLPQLMSKLHCA
jgi:hypothetical protein